MPEFEEKDCQIKDHMEKLGDNTSIEELKDVISHLNEHKQ
jgi:hypothetical protein